MIISNPYKPNFTSSSFSLLKNKSTNLINLLNKKTALIGILALSLIGVFYYSLKILYSLKEKSEKKKLNASVLSSQNEPLMENAEIKFGTLLNSKKGSEFTINQEKNHELIAHDSPQKNQEKNKE